MAGRIEVPRPFLADLQAYAGLNSLIDRALNQFPINAAARAARLQRGNPGISVDSIDPRDNPSRSQFSQGYTAPFQYFASSNTWQTPSGQTSRGRRARQPSTKLAGPQAVIPVQMPWG